MWKVRCLGAGIFIVVAAIFIIIGLAVNIPAPTTPLQWRKVNCENGGSFEPFFFWTRPGNVKEPWCQLSFSRIRKGVASKQIIISQLLSAPRDGLDPGMSRCSQWMTTSLQLDLSYDPVQPLDPQPNIHLEMKLGQVFEDNYKYIISDTGQRTLDCELREDNKLYYRCLLVPLFQLSSVSCPFYSLYIRITTDKSSSFLDRIKSTSVFGISQNEEFTKLWFSSKIVFFLPQVAVLIRYMGRIHQPKHPPKLMERYLQYLGLVLMAFNTPLEVLTLFFDIPFMRVITSIREVALFTMLLVFMDAYFQRPYTGWRRPRRILTVLACLAFLLFQLIDRIIPLVNPFRSLWRTTSKINGITCGFVLLSFAYLASLAVSSMKWWINKKVDNADKLDRTKLIGLDRSTFIVATLTVQTFIMKMVFEENWQDINETDISIQIYWLWNCYVISMMACDHPHLPNDLHQSVNMP